MPFPGLGKCAGLAGCGRPNESSAEKAPLGPERVLSEEWLVRAAAVVVTGVVRIAVRGFAQDEQFRVRACRYCEPESQQNVIIVQIVWTHDTTQELPLTKKTVPKARRRNESETGPASSRSAGRGVKSSSTKRTQVERRADAENRLVTAALQVLARKGWVGMTLAEVGKTAGLSRGLTTHHFGSKAGILRAITTHINESFLGEMAASHPGTSGLDGIIEYINVYLGRKDPRWTNTRSLLLLLGEALLDDSQTGDQLQAYNLRMFEFLRNCIADGIRTGEIKADVQPSFGAEFVVGAMRGIMLQRLIGAEVIGAEEIRSNLVRLIRSAFAAENSVQKKTGRPGHDRD